MNHERRNKSHYLEYTGSRHALPGYGIRIPDTSCSNRAWHTFWHQRDVVQYVVCKFGVCDPADTLLAPSPCDEVCDCSSQRILDDSTAVYCRDCILGEQAYAPERTDFDFLCSDGIPGIDQSGREYSMVSGLQEKT